MPKYASFMVRLMLSLIFFAIIFNTTIFLKHQHSKLVSNQLPPIYWVRNNLLILIRWKPSFLIAYEIEGLAGHEFLKCFLSAVAKQTTKANEKFPKIWAGKDQWATGTRGEEWSKENRINRKEKGIIFKGLLNTADQHTHKLLYKHTPMSHVLAGCACFFSCCLFLRLPFGHFNQLYPLFIFLLELATFGYSCLNQSGFSRTIVF